jgi:3'-phosphoadenosine 5'-phosphosulfate sulfotransferase (PAPS reductase)/FAD synthetase
MTPEQIVNQAIEEHDPSHVILAISGGYDSLCMAHYIHTHMTLDRPLLTYAIDTLISADGWREWICDVADSYGWRFDIYTNRHGWNQCRQWVSDWGNPYSVSGHKRAYNRLKGRAFDAMLRDHKTHRHDRILFLTGIRQMERGGRSERANLQSPYSPRTGAAVWANPLFYWSDDDILRYRIENELPVNPFYETVGGSGDCQCNWGRFITLRKLQKFSPQLAAGRVAEIDRLSKEGHGYGWDGTPANQQELFADFEDGGEACSPFLCAGCSRSKTPTPGKEQAAQDAYIQAAFV